MLHPAGLKHTHSVQIGVHARRIPNHRDIEANHIRCVERLEITVKGQEAALCQLLTQNRTQWRCDHARVGLRQPGIVRACPDQKRTAAGQGLQVDVGANVLGPWMFGECRSAEQSRFLAAIEVHDNGAIERRFTGQHAQRLDDASNSGSVVCLFPTQSVSVSK